MGFAGAGAARASGAATRGRFRGGDLSDDGHTHGPLSACSSGLSTRRGGIAGREYRYISLANRASDAFGACRRETTRREPRGGSFDGEARSHCSMCGDRMDVRLFPAGRSTLRWTGRSYGARRSGSPETLQESHCPNTKPGRHERQQHHPEFEMGRFGNRTPDMQGRYQSENHRSDQYVRLHCFSSSESLQL